jgi:hypothetical protein
MKRPSFLAVIGAAMLVLPAGAQAAEPIPSDPADGPAQVPDFIGSAASAEKVKTSKIPEHPYMAPNGRSSVHNDGYQSDTYRWAGPLGTNPQVTSQFFGQLGLCGITIGFDSQGRLLTICVSGTTQQLRLLDPVTLDTLATYDGLPPRVIPPGVSPFVSGGGAYFYVDERDRSIISTGRQIQVIALGGGATPAFSPEKTFDVSSVVAEGDQLNSAVPDWKGRLWFVSRYDGVVGAIDQESGEIIASLETGEEIENSFAVDDDGGVYIVTDHRLYRFDMRKGRIETTWRHTYENTGEQKPGQLGAGSGTTPTVMGKKYVAITDNADPMNIVVYRRGSDVARGDRVVCEQPVFEKGAGATENSLIGTDDSLVVENNYGYAPPPDATEGGKTTTPGIERVDIVKKGKKGNRKIGCKSVWRNDSIAPSVVPKLSLKTGLVYTITKPEGSPDAWYVTAIDFATGRTEWSKLLGTGRFYNNHYAGIAISPTGALYSGVLGGTVRLADG